ncbi:hypothetical protein J5N97_013942 [Dioscorea zingiberensis]|uniref:ATPase AAA-type core domain-containing protein n=1 Tax=Dioscorea zingiberensis TaxID=325984 RepID=A0A9D5HJB2_9LILI|nr:hypothetical protein J5N97_013942 [Dioscorea zingiberensis]
MVRDVFRLAKENAPAIIFIDEVDAIATARFDAQTGADREVQRILMELLNQMDGFDQTVNVKVIMATNRADTLDPALLRPGRLDRKIEFPLPDRRQKRLVFQVCTAKMNLSDEVDLEDYVSRPDKISAAEAPNAQFMGILKTTLDCSNMPGGRDAVAAVQARTHICDSSSVDFGKRLPDSMQRKPVTLILTFKARTQPSSFLTSGPLTMQFLRGDEVGEEREWTISLSSWSLGSMIMDWLLTPPGNSLLMSSLEAGEAPAAHNGSKK